MPTTYLSQAMGEIFTSATSLTSKVVISLFVVIILLAARHLFKKIILNRSHTTENIYFWNKVINYSLVTLGTLIIGGIWLYGISNLATFLGLLSAGLAIALREPIVNLAGWFFILLRRPFVLGDRIELKGAKGDVIDIRPFSFTLMEIGNWVQAEQSTGRIIHIPNAAIFSQAITNYTQGFEYLWEEIPVLITFESNWEKAKQLLMTILEANTLNFPPEAERQMRATAAEYYIKIGTLSPTVYTSVEDSGVLLTMRYITPTRQRRDQQQRIWEAVLRAFAQAPDIDLAYPTQRVYFNPREGKPGTGGPRK